MTDKTEMVKKSLTHQAIFYGFTFAILLCESIFILVNAVRKGVCKREEILSKKSKLGFDFKIIIK